MLIEFSVENYLSFKDKVTFSMLSSTSKSKEENSDALFELNNQTFLKSAMIYGANASGKSNLLQGLSFIRSKVLDFPRQPPLANFKLDTSSAEKPSTFEIIFLAKNISEMSKLEYLEFRYGFQLKEDKVVTEWLFGRFTAQESMLFTRKGDAITIGARFKEAAKVHRTLGKINQENLFLSLMIDIKGEQDKITSMLITFFKKLRNLTGIRDFNFWKFTNSLSNSEKYKPIILKMLKSADIGIEDFYVTEKNLTRKIRPTNGVEEKYTRKTLKSQHNVYSNQKLSSEKEEFDFQTEESDGTKMFFTIVGPILKALKDSEIIVIDELDAKLHPKLLILIVNIFNSPLNKYGAQLIATVHNTILLDKDILRRDQIYIVDKSLSGESSVYALSEFAKYRKDANYENDYLMGKLGGIPFIGNIDFLWDEE